MAENNVRSHEYRELPEHTSHREYGPVNPDIAMFRESAVTAAEENVFQGTVPPGEEENPLTAARRKRREKKKFAFLNRLLGGAARAAAIVFGLLLVVGLIVLLNRDSSDSREALQAKEILEAAQRPFQTVRNDYGPGQIGGVWKGDPAAPHKYDLEHPVIVKEASCTGEGELNFVCLECGVILTEVLAAHGHSPADAVMENEEASSCLVRGKADKVVYCNICGEELSRNKVELALGPHTPKEAVEENRIEATCTEDGSYDTVIYCEVCGEELSRAATVIAAAGHAPGEAVTENETAATCTEDGSCDTVIYCEICGEEISRETVVLEATGHTEGEPVVENETAVTCTEDGSYDTVIYCAACGEELSRETTVTAATGHNYTDRVTAATCTARGYTTHSCSKCGTSYTDTYTAALGHNYTARVTAATCTAQGYTTHTCSRCGNSYRNTYTAALGHNFGGATASTCTRGCGTRAITISYNASARGFNFTLNNTFYDEFRNSGNSFAGMTVTDRTNDDSTFNSYEYESASGASGTIGPGPVAPVSGHKYRLGMLVGSTWVYSNTVTVP